MTITERRPAEVFPPGEFIRAELAARGITQADLAARMGCSPSTVSALLEDQLAVTPRLAVSLALVFGTSPEFWTALEVAWQRHGVRRCAWCGEEIPMRPRRERFCSRHCATWHRVEGQPEGHATPHSPCGIAEAEMMDASG